LPPPYDDYMQTILARLLRHQAALGQHVVLMSATLPSRLRADLVRSFAEGAGWAAAEGQPGALDPWRYPLLAVLHAGGTIQPDLPVRPEAGGCQATPGTGLFRIFGAHG
jgi:CRISPR-associated endonuclease/helicase Cas3